jgi:hypothetical protein
MARTLTRASQVYQPGLYGPFSVDGFTNADTERLVATLTVEGWPDDPVVMVVTLTHSINAGIPFGEVCWQVSSIANGKESASLSNEACKTFQVPPTSAPTGLTVK